MSATLEPDIAWAKINLVPMNAVYIFEFNVYNFH